MRKKGPGVGRKAALKISRRKHGHWKIVSLRCYRLPRKVPQKHSSCPERPLKARPSTACGLWTHGGGGAGSSKKKRIKPCRNLSLDVVLPPLTRIRCQRDAFLHLHRHPPSTSHPPLVTFLHPPSPTPVAPRGLHQRK